MVNRQKGFGHIEAFLIVAVIAVIGAAGFWVYNNNHKSSDQLKSRTSSEIVSAPEVKTITDLDKASDALEQATSDNDSTEIDALAKEVDSL